MLTFRSFLCATSILAAAAPLATQAPVLLLDLNRRPTGTTVNFGSGFKPLGTTPTMPESLYFSARTEAAGRELWVTWGTAQSTAMVADWNPGPADSDPGPLAFLDDGTVLVVMNHPVAGRELHRIPPGTDMPALEVSPQLAPGVEGIEASGIVAVGGAAHLVVQVPAPGGRVRLLWIKTDGLTHQVLADIANAPRQTVEIARVPTAASDLVFAAIDDGATGKELWTSDGTAAGTRLVQDLVPGPSGSNPTDLSAFRGSCYMAADAPGNGRELVRSDATGPLVVHDLNPGAAGSDPQGLTAHDGQLFFSADDGTHGRELWFADQTDATQVVDINLGSGSSNPGGLTSCDDRLNFRADNGQTGEEWFWYERLGGVGFYDIEAGTAASVPSGWTLFDGRWWFAATTAAHGTELWRSNATGTGADLAADLVPGTGSSDPHDFVNVNGTLVFAGHSVTDPDEPYVVVPSGTPQRLADLNGPTPATRGAAPTQFVALNGLTYFTADDGVAGFELHVTDGTAAGTRRVADLNPGVTSTLIGGLRPLGDKLLLAANVPPNGNELQVVDPYTGQHTTIDIRPGSPSSTPRELAGPFAVRGASKPVVFFFCNDGTYGEEPWRSDGTAAGTFLLRDVYPGTASSQAREFTPIGGGLVLFAAVDDTHGVELWVTDGQASGTRLVADIQPGNQSSVPGRFAVLRGVAYFGANGPNDNELWRSDGTPGGTYEVADINPRGHSNPGPMVVLGGRLFFAARTPDRGRELWVSDGTRAGTRLFADIDPGPPESSPHDLVTADDKIFFTASSGFSSGRLWVTDGSFGVTALPGPANARELTAVGNKCYLAAGDGATNEFWISDGTPEGTVMTKSFFDHAYVAATTAVNNFVFANIDDGVIGQEPYLVRSPGANVEAYGTPCGSAFAGTSASSPRLGGVMTLSGTSVPPEHVAGVLMGLPPSGPTPDVQGCSMQIDPGLLIVVDAFLTGVGTDWTRGISIPDDPALIDGVLATWTIYLPIVQDSSLQATNGLRFALGR